MTININTVKIERVLSIPLVAPNWTVKISKFPNLFSRKLMWNETGKQLQEVNGPRLRHGDRFIHSNTWGFTFTTDFNGLKTQ